MRAVWRISKILIINILILFVLLVPIELLFGDWLCADSDIDVPNARPNTLYVEPSPAYPSRRTITYSRDQYGFRGGSGEAARIDVLAIGGSTTNDRYLDDADTWIARLQRLLGDRDCRVTIANAGIDGYSTFGHIASFSRWFNRIPGLKPRFMLVYVGINDALLEPTALPVEERPLSWWRRAEYYAAAHSAVRRLYMTVRGWWRARQGGVLHGEVPTAANAVWEPAPLPADFTAMAARRTAAYRDRLERLGQLIRGFGSIPVYITQQRVDGRQVDDNWQQITGSNGAIDTAILLAIDRTTLDFCRDRGEVCIDLGGNLRFERSDYYDAVHTTVSGSARIADFLAGELAPIVCPPARRP